MNTDSTVFKGHRPETFTTELFVLSIPIMKT